MAENYTQPSADSNQAGEDNEQRIDGDGQEVNNLRFLGAGRPPAPPPPAITPVSSGVSQPLQTQPQQPPPSQTPHPPSQPAQHSQPPMSNVGSFDYSDPSNAYTSMPSVPMSGPYGMPGQVPPGMMGGGPMMMMPPYHNYMYPPYYMQGPYPSMPSTAANHPNVISILNHYRVTDPKGYREWYKKYSAFKRNPDRYTFPSIPGYPNITVGPGSSQSYRTRKESTRSSVNGDSFRHAPNDTFSNLDYSHVPGANTSMSHAYGRRGDHHRQQPHSGRTSVNGDYRPPPEEDYEIDGADRSSLAGGGGNGILNTTYREPDRPQSGRSSTVGEAYRLPPGDVYGSFADHQHESLGYDNSNYRFQPIVEQTRQPSPRRMTPLKFSTLHCLATISPLGHLIKIKNSGSALEFLQLKQFIGHLPEYKEMNSFPGPLTRETHKNDVIKFCRRKIEEARSNTAQIDRDNFIFLWDYLILMLRQNGLVVGTDIADLLLEAAKEEANRAAQVEEIRDDIEIEGDDGEGEEIVPAVIDPPPEVLPSRDEDKLVKEFCEHLLRGHKRNALDFAMDNGLWGYALFFASKMDDRSYGHVLAKFANGIPLNSPLQTLYHIMCGKQPTCVTSCADESFGDWKPHLAMLLSNRGYKPAIENKAIVTLGDTLSNRNHKYAAQFCYLQGQEEFHKDSRLGELLGYSASAKNIIEATQMTEVYEFAKKLADSQFSLGLSFMQSKLEYAKTLISYGFVQDALSYCEEITKALKCGNIGDEELILCTNTLKIAERIASADETGSASTWIDSLRVIINDPMSFYRDNYRKMSAVSSSHDQGSDQMSYTSQHNQQQQLPSVIQPQDMYDPYSNNQNMITQDASSNNSTSLSHYATAPQVSQISSNASVAPSTLSSDNTYTGIPEMPQGNDWNNANQLNGGFNLSAPQTQQIYDVSQQQQQMPINSSTSTNLYDSGSGTGSYQPPMVPGYPPNNDKLSNSAQASNNNYIPFNPYNQPTPANENMAIAHARDQPYNGSAASKKKSVRFEDDHELHGDVENSVGNGAQSVLRTRVVSKRSDSVELKSAIKTNLEKYENLQQQLQNCRNGDEHLDIRTLKNVETGRYNSIATTNTNDNGEVEYKSTYPIDEPIESASNIPKTSPITPPLPFSSNLNRNSKTFPIDKKCCDVNKPCEEHDYPEEVDESFQNGASHLPSHYGYDKTENMAGNQPSVTKPSSPNKKSGDQKKAVKQDKTGSGQQGGWISGIFNKLSLKPKNQMILPDDKNPAIVWDESRKRWVNSDAAEGEDDLAPAGPPPKDSELIGMGNSGPMSNGPMSLPPTFNSPPYQPTPTALNNLAPVQQPFNGNGANTPFNNGLGQSNQLPQNPGMLMNVPQHQQQLQPSASNEALINATTPKYRLRKNIKNYVDPFKPNGGPRSVGGDVPPVVPVDPQATLAQAMFIPPSSNQPSDGPISFLTTASAEDILPPDPNNPVAQAPPMFNPSQFPGYPQGQ